MSSLSWGRREAHVECLEVGEGQRDRRWRVGGEGESDERRAGGVVGGADHGEL